MRIIVIAKEPVPGRVKTRLCPPLMPEQAAAVAEAALADTLETVAALDVPRTLALDGRPGGWLPPDYELIAQRGAGLAERLAAAFADAGGPALLVGMDTPQLTAELLRGGLALLEESDAVLGAAFDGGYWSIGLRRPDPRVFSGVPMSRSDTAACQRARIAECGLGLAELPRLCDVDTFTDALAVARLTSPASHFAAALGNVGLAAA